MGGGFRIVERDEHGYFDEKHDFFFYISGPLFVGYPLSPPGDAGISIISKGPVWGFIRPIQPSSRLPLPHLNI